MNLEKGAQVREGKAKIIFQTNHPEGHLLLSYKDDATAFNAKKKGTIEDKGRINNAVSNWLFRHLEKKGVETHLVERLSERETLVKHVEIIPVEVVVRNKAAGSICKRLGFEKKLVFNPPLVEYFYKSDELDDPPIGTNHILYFKWATQEELNFITESALKVNEELSAVFKEIGLELVDFKLEFGRDKSGKVILADEFTGDACRLWDLDTGEPMDKDRFRHDMGGVKEAYLEVYGRLKAYFEGN